ncbi:Ig-like domain-containing protein, partial [Aquisphaera insulae]|uniref:Ig-like domain-containing protein n=1 Tax=Aquisphaera insulae TaxID=2712864 RepID=UPI0013ED15EC
MPVTFTARVLATGMSPEGNVAFLEDGTVIDVEPLVNSVATCIVSNLAVAGHAITACYQGDPRIASSQSRATSHVVTPYSTVTTVDIDAPRKQGSRVLRRSHRDLGVPGRIPDRMGHRLRQRAGGDSMLQAMAEPALEDPLLDPSTGVLEPAIDLDHAGRAGEFAKLIDAVLEIQQRRGRRPGFEQQSVRLQCEFPELPSEARRVQFQANLPSFASGRGFMGRRHRSSPRNESSNPHFSPIEFGVLVEGGGQAE